MENSLKEWSIKTSNHALPRLINSKNKLLAISWTLLFLGSTYYCASSIINDIYAYSQFKTNTKVNVTNAISVEIPTISICADLELRNNDSNFSVILVDCEINRGRYWESEKCGNENFYKHPNNICLTFNTSFFEGKVTGGVENSGLKITFRNNETNSTGLFALFHSANSMPVEPSYDNSYIDLFPCKDLDAKTQITYFITSRWQTHKLAYPYSNCVDDWTTIDKGITNEIPAYLKNEYNEEACFDTCSLIYGRNDTRCNLLCPFNCYSQSYKASYSRLCNENGDKQETSVSLFLRDTWYTSVEEVEGITVGRLLGAIGGRLSIALGMSAISLIDFIEGFVWLFYSIFKPKRRIGGEMTITDTQQEVSLVVIIKNELRQWSTSSSIHGVSHFTRSKYLILKVIWLLGITGSLIYCGVTLEKNFTIYNSFAVRSKYTIERDSQTYYPALTFCSQEDLYNDSIFIEKKCFASGEERIVKSESIELKAWSETFLCYTLNSNVARNGTMDLVSVIASGNADGCKYRFLLNGSYLFVYIHNQSELPFHGRSLLLERGLDVTVGLSRSYKKMCTAPYSNCAALGWDSIDRDLIKFMNKHSYYDYKHFAYNQEACLEYCVYKKTAETHNFTLDEENSIYDLFNSYLATSEEELLKTVEACKSLCPVRCNDMKLEYNVVSSQIASNETMIYVFYEETSYTQIADEPKLSADELVASIGGQLGLCIGMSMLSIIDLLFLLVALIVTVLNKRK